MMWRGFVVVAFLVLSGEAQARATHWRDIKYWEKLGERWMLALDERGEPLAIYDFTYPEVTLDNMRLGDLGEVPLDQDGQIRAAIESTARVEGGNEANVKRLLKRWDAAKAHLEKGLKFEDGWWRKVPWRAGSTAFLAARADRAPDSFRFSDIAIERWVRAGKRDAVWWALERAERYADTRLRNRDAEEQPPYYFETLAEALEKGMLSWIEFRRLPPRSQNLNETQFEMVFKLPPTPKVGRLSEWDALPVARPSKMVDFWWLREGMVQSLLDKGIRIGTGQIIGQIPIPALANLIGLALGRMLGFHDELRSIRQSQLLEMIDHATDAEEGLVEDAKAPFLRFDYLYRQWAMSYIYYARSDFLNVWGWWIFGKRPARQWPGDRARYRERALQVAQRYRKKKWDYVPINVRFGEAREFAKILLSGRKPYAYGDPYTGVDYAHPDRILVNRALLTTASMATQYALGFVPLVGGLLHSLYALLADQPMQESALWEGRLEVALEHHAEAPRFERARDLLNRQRFNPFELSRTGMKRVRERRLHAIGWEER